MNNIHSDIEWIYKKRWIGSQIRSAIETFPVVVISGARQVGKSTFLLYEFSDFKYITLDDFSTLEQAKKDPFSLWKGESKVIIDEAQRAPEIFNAIKILIDRDKRKSRFLISGSSNLLLMKGITESLAGRAIYFEMLPMTYGEMKDVHSPKNFFNLWEKDFFIKEAEVMQVSPLPYILRGFMPPLIHLKEMKDVFLWWEGYIKTYIERDLRELSQIESIIDFKKVIDSLAFRTGNLLNQTEVARDTGVSQPTVHRYIKILEVSNIVKRIYSYHLSRKKRLLKTPKLFFVDPGLSVYLSGYHDEDSLNRARELGNFFETTMFLHLKVLAELMIPKANIYYWRTITDKEVDFVIEHGRKLLAIEIKLTKTPLFQDVKCLLAFIEEYPETLWGILLHTGSSIKWLHSKILAVPWWWIIV